jgi:hypothetical protein
MWELLSHIHALKLLFIFVSGVDYMHSDLKNNYVSSDIFVMYNPAKASCYLPREIDRRFVGAYCLHHQGGYAGLMMEVVSTSETSENFHQGTRLDIPEDSHLQEYVCCYERH